MTFPLLQHRTAWRAEVAVFGAAVLALGTFLVTAAPLGRAPALLVLAALGLLLWSGLEYAWHRFVQHRVEPFARWHLGRPRPPTAVPGWVEVLGAVSGVALAAALATLAAGWLLGPLNTCALALGLFTGYLGYALVHRAVHQTGPHAADPALAAPGTRPPAGFDWMRHRALWHARHHRMQQPCCYGISTTVWDRVFGTSGHPH